MQMSAVLHADKTDFRAAGRAAVPSAFERDRSLSSGGVSRVDGGSGSTGCSGGATGLMQSQDSLSGICKATQGSWERASFEWDFNTRVPPDGLGSCVTCFPKEHFTKKKPKQNTGKPAVNVLCHSATAE